MTLPTYVIGHRNPDSDAICSAIAYADYKVRRGDASCVPARCGNSNARIDAILARFRQPLPLYLSDVTPRVREIMTTGVIKVSPESTCAEALELIDHHDIRTLPVVDADNRVAGLVSVFQLGGFFLPQMKEVRQMRRVHATLAAIARSLKAKVHHLVDENRLEELFVRIGAMDIRSFGRYTEADNIPWDQTIIIRGDPELIGRISYPHSEGEDTFDLPGIVSRKKQLIPYLTSLLQAARAEGSLPAKE